MIMTTTYLVCSLCGARKRCPDENYKPALPNEWEHVTVYFCSSGCRKVWLDRIKSINESLQHGNNQS